MESYNVWENPYFRDAYLDAHLRERAIQLIYDTGQKSISVEERLIMKPYGFYKAPPNLLNVGCLSYE